MKIQKFILLITDFKTKKEQYKSINSITLIVLEKTSYPYVCITNRIGNRIKEIPERAFENTSSLQVMYVTTES